MTNFARKGIDLVTHTKRTRLINATFLICAGAVLAFALYPGRFDNDSSSMYQQGQTLQLHDWHSPLMSTLMAALSPLDAGPGPLFLVQILLWIVGLLVFTDTLIEAGRPYAAQLISIVSMIPLVSFHFIEVQKDVLLVALVSIFVGFGVRAVLGRLRWGPIFAFVLFALLVLALDARKNAFIILIMIAFLYFPVRIFSLGAFAKTAIAGVLLIGAGTVTANWLDHSVLGANRLHPVALNLAYDLAGISVNGNYDASDGTLGDFFPTESKCYKPAGADPYILECKTVGDRALALAANSETQSVLIKQWLIAVATHPIAYIKHRVRFFFCFIRIGCEESRYAMGQGLITRPTWPDASRVTTLGRVLETAALKSYASFLADGWLWLIILSSEVAIMAFLLSRHGYEPVRYVVLVIASSALAYETAFFFIGVSSSLRYFHVIFFLGTISIPLCVSAIRRPQ
jgi:hypothetical protein